MANRTTTRTKDGIKVLFVESGEKTHVISEKDDLIGHITFKGKRETIDEDKLFEGLVTDYMGYSEADKVAASACCKAGKACE